MTFNLGSKSVLYAGCRQLGKPTESKMRAIGTLFLALAASAAVAAEVYTWRDSSGKVHYSDAPPPGVAAQKMRGGVAVDAPASAAPQRSLAEQERAFRQRKAESEQAGAKAEKEKTDAEESSRNCEGARAQLAALESGRRMSKPNAQGEQIPLDDEARGQEIERAQKSVKSWCK
jgi:DNA-binding IclR family transcriptional regulator